MARITIHEKATLLRDAVFAADDGIVTTFAVVAGSAGAHLSASVVLILGFANLFADGLSMASGNYLGIKSEMEYQDGKRVEKHKHSPSKHGMVTFVSFLIAGLSPLLPFLFFQRNTFSINFYYSIGTVLISLFLIGCIKAYVSSKNFIRGGFEMLVIGGISALVAYIVGFLIDTYVI